MPDFLGGRNSAALLCAGAASGATRAKGRIGPWVQDLPIQEEVRERPASVGEFRMAVKDVRNARKSVEFGGNAGPAKHLQQM